MKFSTCTLALLLTTAVAVSAISWKEVGTAACVGAGLYGASCLQIVTTGNVCLIERLGKYHRILEPGWNFLWRPVDTISLLANVREQQLDIPPQPCFTADNAPIRADAVVFLRIIDPVKARYSVSDVMAAIQNLCLTQLREQIGKLTLDETFSSRDVINTALLQGMNHICENDWGVLLNRVEIQTMEPSPDIVQAMELQMSAERRKRAAILQSEGERASTVNAAEAAAQALLAQARAEAETIRSLAQANADRVRTEAEALQFQIQAVVAGIAKENSDVEATQTALQMLLWNRYIEAQEKVAKSPEAKILMFPTKDSIPLTHSKLGSALNF